MSNYIALYRKYRPRIFSDVVGQEHITKVLKSEVMQGSVSHAYLFCGSRGTGKTTCAKILAKAVSCENPQNGDPCGECEKCRAFDSSFDILEMDAASNNGVDDVRDLREKINFLPIEMKRRVYIIDEVHMLSPGAFNALLKTLEEPPEHVMFILATTELNKIPATILSRCKRFDFHRISSDDIVKRLEYVCAEEKIGIDNSALRLISNLATGAMRDALSMLELFVGQEKVTREDAEASLGVVGNEIVLNLLKQIASADTKGALETVNGAYSSSKDPAILCTELGNLLRDLLVMKYASTSVSTLIDDQGADVIAVLRDIEDSFTPERLLYCTEIVEQTSAKLARSGLSRRTVLEIMAMRLCDSRLSTSTEALLERVAALESAPRASFAGAPAVHREAPVKEQQPAEEAVIYNEPSADSGYSLDGLVPPEEEAPEKAPAQTAAASSQKTSGSSNLGDEMLSMGEVIEAVKEEDMILYSMVTDAKGYLNGDVLSVKLNPMGYFMITSNDAMKEALTRICSKILGYSVNLSFLSDDGGQTGSAPSFPEI